MLLATLHDEFDATLAVALSVLRPDRFRRAVDHHVGILEQVVQGAGNLQTRLAHGVDAILQRSEQPEPLLQGCSHPPVGLDVGDADELHVALARNGIGDTLSDDAVPVQRDADLSLRCYHL